MCKSCQIYRNISTHCLECGEEIFLNEKFANEENTQIFKHGMSDEDIEEVKKQELKKEKEKDECK